MIRVLQVIATLDPSDGGPAEAAWQLHQAWADDPAVDSRVLSWRDRDQHTPGVLSLAGSSARASSRLVREAVASADLLYMHGYYLPKLVTIARCARARDVPYLLQPHGVFEPYQTLQRRGRKRLFDVIVGRRLIAGATAMVFATTREAEVAMTPAPARKMVLLLGGALHAPRRESVHTGGTQLLFLGRIAPKKRLDLLLDAWSVSCDVDPESRLVLAGPDPERLLPPLLERLPRNARDRVEVVGAVDRQEREALLRASDMFVLPSDNENFAIALVEAASFGLAVVTTPNVAVASEFERSEAAELVHDQTAEALAAALIRLLRDPHRRAELGASAQRIAQEHLTWKAAADRARDAFADLAAGR